MKLVWKGSAALAILLLAACGGGNNGNVALSKNFSYGAPSAPTTAEQTAATTAQTTVSGTSTFTATPDATTASAIVGLGDDLAASALGASAIGAMVPPPSLRAALRSAATTACTTTGPTGVTFTNCMETDSGYSFVLNGSISVANNVVTWDVTGNVSGASGGVSFNLTLHQHGNLTVTATTMKGDSLSEMSGVVSGNGQSISFALDGDASVDLTYSQSCVDSGTIEVKRVWAQRPNGATGPAFADVAVKLTWTGCNTVQVQHSI